MNRKMFYLALFCALSFPWSLFAQDSYSLRGRIAGAIRKNEKQWTLKNNTLTPAMNQMGFDMLYLGWSYRKHFTESIILIYSSPADAAKAYPSVLRSGCIDCLVKMKELDIKIPNLGEENHVWQDQHMHLSGIVFRKGKIIVGVDAPSMETARKFASHIANEINQ